MEHNVKADDTAPADAAHAETLNSEDALDAQATAIDDVPDDTGDGGKLRMIMQLVKRSFGVKDLASMRLSLPASLLEPIPNLEYWHYLDRPDLFAAINDYEEPFERMLAVLRFSFSKDIRHIRGKPCKPYNSVLGENFRMHWDVPPVSYDTADGAPIIHAHIDAPPTPLLSPSHGPHLVHSDSGSIKAAKPTRTSAFGSLLSMKGWSSPAVDRPLPPVAVESNLAAKLSDLSLASTRTGESGSVSVAGSTPPTSTSTAGAEGGSGARRRTAYLTEQISHHPPISAYAATCPAAHATLVGVDHFAVRVLPSASVRVAAGAANKGLFIALDGGHGVGERYHVTNPVAHVNGVLRGSFYLTFHESTIVTCTGGPGVGDGEWLRAIIEYKEESWLGKPHFAVEGVVHRYTPGAQEHEEWTKVKHVPAARAVAFLEGSWRGLVRWRRASAASSTSSRSSKSSAEWTTLIDLAPLRAVPKRVRPLDAQHATESRKLWDSVTARLLSKEFGEATRAKHVIEQRQRDEAAERRRRGVEFVPQFFEQDIESGMPVLTPAGREALEAELKLGDADAETDVV
ncbi:hypothetical protein BC834DRAFT_908663 [Gloeopeniophorella convolvens]|nr:hypothetical protein BC834DRAFT_908663 [Gloeopeniophorella convolvens]